MDIDGTLLGKEGVISAADKEALARAASYGVRVSLSTGRVPLSAASIIRQLALTGYHIFADGALIAKPENGEEVYVKPIIAGTISRIVEYVHQEKIYLELFSTSRFFVEQEAWGTTIRRRFFGLEPDIVSFNQLGPERIIKGTLVVSSAGEKAKAKSFQHRFKDSLDFSLSTTPSYPGVDFINVLAPDVSKGQALETLVSYLGISLNEVIAIGNGSNDVPLLAKAGLAIAVEDAPDELKAVADYITLDADHGGVAAAIDKFLTNKG